MGLFAGPASPVTAVFGGAINIYVDGKKHIYDLASKSWQEQPAKKYSAVYRQPNGIWVSKAASAWSMTGNYSVTVSEDDGNTWKSIEKGALAFYRFKNGESLRPGKAAKVSLFSGASVVEQVPIESSSDNGKTWEVVGRLKFSCHSFNGEASTDERLVALCNDGEVVLSEDRGRTWQTIIENTSLPFEAFPGPVKVKFDRERKLNYPVGK